MTDIKEISAFKAELADRFGTLPPETVNLLLKIMLKVLTIKAGVRRLDMTEHQAQATLYFSEAHQKNSAQIVNMAMSDSARFRFASEHTLCRSPGRKPSGSDPEYFEGDSTAF